MNRNTKMSTVINKLHEYTFNEWKNSTRHSIYIYKVLVRSEVSLLSINESYIFL
jgi:hypothetical protein